VVKHSGIVLEYNVKTVAYELNKIVVYTMYFNVSKVDIEILRHPCGLPTSWVDCLACCSCYSACGKECHWIPSFSCSMFKYLKGFVCFFTHIYKKVQLAVEVSNLLKRVWSIIINNI